MAKTPKTKKLRRFNMESEWDVVAEKLAPRLTRYANPVWSHASQRSISWSWFIPRSVPADEIAEFWLYQGEDRIDTLCSGRHKSHGHRQCEKDVTRGYAYVGFGGVWCSWHAIRIMSSAKPLSGWRTRNATMDRENAQGVSALRNQHRRHSKSGACS